MYVAGDQKSTAIKIYKITYIQTIYWAYKKYIHNSLYLTLHYITLQYMVLHCIAL